MNRWHWGLLLGVMVTSVHAAEPNGKTPPVPAQATVELNSDEQKFVELLTAAKLVGTFTSDSRPSSLRPEQYNILTARKVKDAEWIVEAKMTYQNVEIPIPIPVQVYWAGDTPMLQVTNLSIPLLGDGFYARVLFYQDRYAGTWQHGSQGGHLQGKIVKADSQKPTEAESGPEKKTNTK
ncbi:hypothetical protein [Planctomicrobium sp. SH527]|uniref:hypothetical protein n=1 Tax=Planctomicrobium sp. SH527 TaxID=3448123 RepID=UPI003F5B9696